MPGFLYYIPRGGPMTAEEAAPLGLGYAFDKDPECRDILQHGPDDGSGVILHRAVSGRSCRVGCYPNEQAWQSGPSGKFHVGFFTASPPTPQDLARDELLSGEMIKLGEHDWMVPICRDVDEDAEVFGCYSTLPASRVYGDDGKWHRLRPLARYESLWQISNDYFDRFMGVWRERIAGNEAYEPDDDTITFTLDNETDAALTILQANYRIGPTEASILGLFDDRSVGKILNTAANVNAVFTWLKKKLATDGDSTGDGQQDEAQDIGQP